MSRRFHRCLQMEPSPWILFNNSPNKSLKYLERRSKDTKYQFLRWMNHRKVTAFVSATPQVQHLSEIGFLAIFVQDLHHSPHFFIGRRIPPTTTAPYTLTSILYCCTMVRLTIALLALAVTSADAFKFMSNWKMPTVLTDEQKVKIAKMEERFGDKSKQLYAL